MSDKNQSALHTEGERPKKHQSMAGCFLLIAWSVGGFTVLVSLWGLILRERSWTLTIRDVLYWAVVLGMIAARYASVSGQGEDSASGEPTAAGEVRRYTLSLLAASGVAWCIAQSVDG